jgi:hypothetical protein
MVVALLAASLAVGLVSHHEETAAQAAVTQEEIAPVADGFVEALSGTIAGVASGAGSDVLAFCSLLLLCCVILLAASLRARRAAIDRGLTAPSAAAPRLLAVPVAPVAAPVSLHTLSISRT